MGDKWIDFFIKLGITSSAQILLLTILGFFGKQIIKYFFDASIEIKKTELSKDIETYKQTLGNQTEQHRLELNKILETHRSDLNLINSKNSKLHDQQLQIIAELYKRIVIMERTFEQMIAFIKPVYSDAEKEEKDRIHNAGIAYNDYFCYYSENKIFFSEDICHHLDKLRQQFWESHWDYTFKQRTGVSDYRETREHFENAAKIVNEKIPEVLKQLNNNFRALLTVE